MKSLSKNLKNIPSYVDSFHSFLNKSPQNDIFLVLNLILYAFSFFSSQTLPVGVVICLSHANHLRKNFKKL